MRQLICSLLVLLAAFSPSALAQPFSFGEPLPLPDTRYGSFSGEGRLVSNGTHAFLAWADGSKLRMTRIVDGERRVGRPILDIQNGWFDVVWTGLHFVAVGYRRSGNADQFLGRLVGFDGEPFGDPFVIGNAQGQPRLAFDGTSVLLQYRSGNLLNTAALNREGRPLQPLPDTSVLPHFVVDAALASRPPGFVTTTAYPDVIAFGQTDSSGQVVASVPISVTRNDDRKVAVATNPAREILSVWTNVDASIDAAIIRNDGAVLERFSIADSAGARDVAALWDGSRWVVAYIAQGRLQVRRFGGGAPEERLQSSDASATSSVALTSVQGHTYAAWRGTSNGASLVVRNLSGGADLAAFAAAEQTLYDVTSSNGNAIAVWSELRDGRRTLHAGVRSASGAWRETPIGTDETAAFVATDGTGFAVIRAKAGLWTATLLDSQARILGTSSEVSGFTPTGVVWTGTAYAVVGTNTSGNIVGALLLPSATVTPTRTLVVKRAGRQIENPRMAARAGELLVVWQDTEFIVCFPVCDPYDSLVHGARFTSSLDRIDTDPFSIAPDTARHPDAIWNGIHYVIVWENEGQLKYRTLRSNGAISGILSLPGTTVSGRVPRVSLIPGGVGIAHESGEVVALYEGSAVRFENLGRTGARDAIVTLGNDIAYLQTLSREEMPYHGATRLQARIGALVPHPAPPSAPRITRAELPPGTATMILEWAAPPESVNGYRVEYRVDEGAWNELDEWFDPNKRDLTIRPWRTAPVRYQFRVRAWSDSGLGAYSAPATVRMVGMRQRAVR